MRRAILIMLAAGLLAAQAAEVVVNDVAGLRAALIDPSPGRTVLIAPGVYSRVGGFSSTGGTLRGTEAQPIIFRAQDPNNPPEIRDGMYLPGMAWVTFDGLHLTQPPGHNLNADDGGGQPHDISFLNMHFESLPEHTAKANLKLTRIDNITVRGCRFEGWGDEAIDTIGVHGGVIEDNEFIGVAGFRTRMAIQLKGGTWDIIVRNNFLLNTGDRGIMAGGGSSSGAMRPPGADFEAERIDIYGNRIVGGKACFVMSTQNGSRFHHNICYLPSTWIMRVLQENSFSLPNQNATVDHNLFVFADAISDEFVNVGPGTNVQTFVFDNNAYWQVDGDDPDIPNLPVVETNIIDQVDPELVAPGTKAMRIGSSNPVFVGIGPETAAPGPLSGVIAVDTPAGCVWNAVSSMSWVSITAGMTGEGSGRVEYAVEPNPSSAPRTAVLQVAGQAFTVQQAGRACVYSIAPQTARFGAE